MESHEILFLITAKVILIEAHLVCVLVNLKLVLVVKAKVVEEVN